MIFQLNDFYGLCKQFQLQHELNCYLLGPIDQFDDSVPHVLNRYQSLMVVLLEDNLNHILHIAIVNFVLHMDIRQEKI